MTRYATTTVPVPEAMRAGTRAIERLGATPDVAALVVGRLLDAELDSTPSHGLVRIAEYGKAVARGQLLPAATPVVDEVSGAATRIDGRLAFGAVVARELVTAATSHPLPGGLAVIGVRRSGHLGRLGPIGAAISRTGRIILGFVNSGGGARKVIPFGGTDGRLATNPILFACPTADREPVVLDMTTAASSDGAVQVAAARGETVATGVLVDHKGRSVRDPSRLNSVPRTAFLAPLGGYKGFGLGLLVEIMAGALGGADFVAPGNENMGNCGFFVIIAPGVLGRKPDDVLAGVSALTEYVLTSPPQQGQQVRLPGHRPVADRRANIRLATTTWHDICRMADIAVSSDADARTSPR
jgi:LDH2 family malate/lactate/ureidoglycolate dehydrogenase